MSTDKKKPPIKEGAYRITIEFFGEDHSDPNSGRVWHPYKKHFYDTDASFEKNWKYHTQYTAFRRTTAHEFNGFVWVQIRQITGTDHDGRKLG